MDDYNKNKRISMWWSFVISAITIPIFFFFDNREITDNDLVTIDNLVLSENSYYDPGGGKGGTPSMRFKFITIERKFLINSNEYQCVTNKTILENFQKNDIVSIKVDKSDKNKFFKRVGLVNSQNYMAFQKMERNLYR